MNRDDLLEFLDVFIASEPKHGWHCPNVLNFSGQNQRTDSFVDSIKQALYDDKLFIHFLSNRLTELTRKIERYEREIAWLDQDFERYTKLEVVRILTGFHPSFSYGGIYFFDCPHCNHRFHIEDILKENQVVPYSMENLKHESEVRVKYPKVKTD